MVIATNPEVRKTTTRSAAVTNAADPKLQSPSAAPSFSSVSRTPLVPESVLKRHGAYCAIDTRFRAAARLKSALWLKSQGIPSAADNRCRTDPRSFLGSMLNADAARAGKNLLSADVHRLALEQCIMCEDDALLAPARLPPDRRVRIGGRAQGARVLYPLSTIWLLLSFGFQTKVSLPRW